MTATRETIEVPAGEVAAELEAPGHWLRRKGDAAHHRTGKRNLPPAAVLSRARVVAAGLTDEDIDWIIKQAQKGVQPLLG